MGENVLLNLPTCIAVVNVTIIRVEDVCLGATNLTQLLELVITEALLHRG